MKKYAGVSWLLFAAVLNSGFAQTVTSQKGLTSVIFNLKAGNITVHLPDDIRPGDIISGTISAEPAGKNAKQMERNLAGLKKYAVDFNEQKFTVTNTVTPVRYDINNKIMAERTLSLLNDQGVNTASVTIRSVQQSTSSGAYKIPAHVLTGSPLRITGSFDGDASNTRCSLDDHSLEILAESPRGCFVSYPAEAGGLRRLDIRENDQPKCSQNVSGVDMTIEAGTLNLRRGENTFIDINITGLQGLTGMALLTLDNRTANTVTMQPANNLIIPINPDSVGDGHFSRHVDIRSINSGGFTVQVNLALPEAVKDQYAEIPTTNGDIKTDTVPCKDPEELVTLANAALQKLQADLADIDNRINGTQNSFDDCKKILDALLKDYWAKKKIFEEHKNNKDNWEKSGKVLNAEKQANFDKAEKDKNEASKAWSDQNTLCKLLEQELTRLKGRKALLPDLIKKAEEALKKAKDELEKCKTKAGEDKKKKEEEERKKGETKPEPAGDNMNPGTGAGKEGSPCNPDGVELVEPVKRIYGSCYVKETEISPCNTDRISNQLLESIKKAFEKFKKLSGPLEIAEKVASCASTSKAICVNVHVVRNWEDVELTYVCVNGKWVLNNRKVTGRGEDNYGWYAVKDREVGNLCCWIFGKKTDAEDAMEAHLKEAIQDILDDCK